jgi:prevent-host-death family protein
MIAMRDVTTCDRMWPQGNMVRERSLGIRELKAKLSRCVREVRTGSTIVVTERGRPVARLVPEGGSLDERLAILKNAGAILWSGRHLMTRRPNVRVRGRRTVADILVESRG